MKSFLLSRGLKLFYATAILTVLLAPEAQARTRKSSHSGPRGTRESQVDRTPGSVNKSSTFTNNQGQTTAHTATRTADPKSGTVSASASTTLPDGRTASRTLESQRTETGRTTTGTATGFNGKTATIDSTTTRTGSDYNRDTTVTGPNGGKKETTVDVARQDGTTTRTVTRTATPAPKP
jgi:hypothetical protein